MILVFGLIYSILMAGTFLAVSRHDRPFIAVLYSVTLFYGCLAPYYWKEVQYGVFIGVDWSESIARTSSILLASSATLAMSTGLVDKLLDTSRVTASTYITASLLNLDRNPARLLFTAGGLGAMCAAYVVASASTTGGFNRDDPILQIAYQFADLLIPTLIFYCLWNRFDKISVVALLIFSAYSIYLGFRYKLVLVYLPLVISYMIESYDKFGARGFIISSIKSIILFSLMAGLFSIMTLTRQKFGGLDFSGLSDNTSQDVMFGFFAEGNTIFALTSIIENFVDKNVAIGFAPLVNAFFDLIPRALYPSRPVDPYLERVLEGLMVPEAMQSGTAYPYAGELLLMAGYPSLVVGTLLIAIVYTTLRRKVTSCVAPSAVKTGGYGLLAVFFGYYFFSRGYFSQGFKGFIFVLLPYIVLISHTASIDKQHAKQFH